MDRWKYFFFFPPPPSSPSLIVLQRFPTFSNEARIVAEFSDRIITGSMTVTVMRLERFSRSLLGGSISSRVTLRWNGILAATEYRVNWRLHARSGFARTSDGTHVEQTIAELPVITDRRCNCSSRCLFGESRFYAKGKRRSNNSRGFDRSLLGSIFRSKSDVGKSGKNFHVRVKFHNNRKFEFEFGRD